MLFSPFISRSRAAGSDAIVAGSGGVPYVLAASGASVSTTGDTNENTLATVTIPAGAMGANGILRISSQWNFTNSGNTKTLRIRFSGASGTQYMQLAATTTATLRDLRWIQNRNSVSSQIGGQASSTNVIGLNTGIIQTSSADTSAATTLVFTGQLASAGESIALESYLVELIKMP